MEETIYLDQLPAWIGAKSRAMSGANLTPLVRVIRLLIVADVRNAFAREADPVTGAAWPRFAASTLRKRRRGKSPKLLRDTGVMAASATVAGSPGNVDEATATGLRFGSAVPRASYHNVGTARIPQRRFIGVGPNLVARINQAVADFAAGLIGGTSP